MTGTPERPPAAAASDFSGVPACLGPPLWNWITDGLGWYGFDYGDDRRIRKVAAALQIPVAEQGASGVIDHLEIRCRADPGFLLDVVQAMLELYGRDRERAFVLAELLNRAGSAYTVRPGWDGLELRLTPGEADVEPNAADRPAGLGHR